MNLYRAATPEDCAALATLHSACFEKGWDAPTFGECLERGAIFVAGTPLSAMIVLQIIGDEAEILTFATALHARRKGLGRGLLTFALAHLQSIAVKQTFLEVACDNVAALALYKNAGFEAFGRRAGYYSRADGARVDAILLRHE